MPTLSRCNYEDTYLDGIKNRKRKCTDRKKGKKKNKSGRTERKKKKKRKVGTNPTGKREKNRN